jgi:hypothetical protein
MGNLLPMRRLDYDFFPSSEARCAGKVDNAGFTRCDTNESGSFGKLRTSFGGWVIKRR